MLSVLDSQPQKHMNLGLDPDPAHCCWVNDLHKRGKLEETLGVQELPASSTVALRMHILSDFCHGEAVFSRVTVSLMSATVGAASWRTITPW